MMLRIGIGICLASALVSGCASRQPGMVFDPVGPAPAPLVKPDSSGTLLVFSAYQQAADFNTPDYRREYTDYQVLSADGKRLQTVRNDTGGMLEAPRPVQLPAGTYRVVARANGYGQVTVPVVIRPNQVTAVHLEGTKASRLQLSGTEPVRLPDGAIVGWHTSTDNLPKP